MPTPSKFPVADPAIVPVEGPMQQTGASDKASRGDAAVSTRPTSQATIPRKGYEGGPDRAPAPYGANNEQLPERMQEALRRLVFQFSTESELSRRQEIRRIKQAHQFWRGLQYLWWDERDQNWHLPFEQKMVSSSSLEDMPRYEFVTNIYQAFGLSLIAVLSQDVPRVRFFPASAQAEEDVAAAKAATEVSALVERNNRVGNLIVDEAFHLWTDGKVGAYVRFVVDGQRFGFHPEMEIGVREVRVGNDCYVCPECGAEHPYTAGKRRIAQAESGINGVAESSPADADGKGNGSAYSPEARAADGGSGAEAAQDLTCDGCGAVLTEEDFVAAEMIAVPSGQTRLRVPNGQEVM